MRKGYKRIKIAKDYKKIYQRLIKEIQYEIENIKQYMPEGDSNHALLRRIELNEALSILNWIVDVLPEIEGKKHRNMFMNEREFKKWKKSITKKV